MTQEEIKAKIMDLRTKWEKPETSVGMTASQIEIAKGFDRIRYRKLLDEMKRGPTQPSQDNTQKIFDAVVKLSFNKGYQTSFQISQDVQLPLPEVQKVLADLQSKDFVVEDGDKDSWAVSVTKRVEYEQGKISFPAQPPAS